MLRSIFRKFALIFLVFAIFGYVASPLKSVMTDPNPLATVRPNAVTISVPELDLAVRWYSEKLGFREVQRKSYPEFKTSLAFLELNGYQVELIEDGSSQPEARRADPPSHTAIQGISQFSFLTTDLNRHLQNTITSKILKRKIAKIRKNPSK